MSNSRMLSERLGRHAAWRHALAAVYVAAMLGYLGWRITIVNWTSPGLSFVYLGAEMMGFILGLTLIFSSWDYRHRESPPPPPGLAVDVFVTTYNEPVELVRRTLRAARDIAYPHRTVLLDDGNRPEMRAMAEELGVVYLARGRNVDAKAGNLNFGLAHSAAEFVMVLDSDHIPLPHALDAMLGFFRDRRVALVQTPQDYYNIDAFQYCNARNGALWHDQSFYYSIAQPCRDRVNGASCVGTSVVYRRAALDAIGGIPVDTVTEDIHTSLKLHKAGYQCVFLPDPLAYGIAAGDLRDYYRTRRRWAHGNLHVLRLENVPFCKELSLVQNLSYLTRGLIYFEGWQQLLLFMVPVGSLLFGWAPFQITVLNVLVVLLFPTFIMILLQEFSCGLSRIWANEMFSAVRFPVHLVAVAGLFGRKLRFRSAAKNFRGRFEWELVAPQLAVIALSFGALAIGVVRLALDFKIGPLSRAFIALAHGEWWQIDWTARLEQGYTLELVAIAGFWALFNALKTGALVRKAFIDARGSSDDYRFAVHLPAEFRNGPASAMARIERISLSFVRARVYGDALPLVGDRLNAVIHLPGGAVPVEWVVTRSAPPPRTFRIFPLTIKLATARRMDEGRIECDLVWRDPKQRDRLDLSLYSVDWHREYMHRDALFATPFEKLIRLLTLRAPFGPTRLEWRPGLYRAPHSGETAFIVLGIERGRPTGSLLAFRPLADGDMAEIELFAESDVERRTVRVLEPQAAMAPGLDGIATRRYGVALDVFAPHTRHESPASGNDLGFDAAIAKAGPAE